MSNAAFGHALDASDVRAKLKCKAYLTIWQRGGDRPRGEERETLPLYVSASRNLGCNGMVYAGNALIAHHN